MALFPLRKGRDEPSVPAAPPPTIEALRRRAMHRLIGASVLVLAGVIGFPLFFDNQPRPIPVDLPIVIPDKGKVAPLVVPVPTPAGAAMPAPAAAVEPKAPVAPAVTAEKPVAPAAVVPPPAATAPVAVEKPAPAAAPSPDADKALALLEGKDAAAKAPAAGERFVVQVGAFVDVDKVREVRRKVEGLGVKTYTQVVDTKDGSRIRVRVGPFADKAEAQRVADKIRKLDLTPAILSL